MIIPREVKVMMGATQSGRETKQHKQSEEQTPTTWDVEVHLGLHLWPPSV